MSEVQQTYLVGPTIHLRAIESDDAASEPSWRQSWFPRARAVSEAKIEDEYSGSGDTTLMAVRNADDVIVGSVLIWFDGAWNYTRPFVARWLAPDAAEAVEAEIVELLLPFLVDEGGAIAALVEVPSEQPLVEAALERIGARFCYRQREAWQLGGQRRDKLGFQLNNRKTLEVFGEPEITAEGVADPEVRAPAPKSWPVVETPPPGAVMVGKRLYLRMFTPADGDVLREASLTDTEFSHDPRFPRSGMTMNARFRRSSEADAPSNLTFAIVLRENDELIGRNELDFLDLVHRSAETGTELFRPKHRGQGYGTEAKHLLLSYAFDMLNLHMVWSNVWEENPRSRAALLKQGYRLAGGIPWRGTYHGIPSGDWVFDLLASEWQAARQ
jgi:RimJ/RimL family protein N-acetyltransferase